MADKATLGKQFLEELSAKLPAAAQEALRSTLSSPEAAAALELAGSRLSPLDEERQRLTALQTQLNDRDTKLQNWHRDLSAWKTDRETHYTDREQKVAAREAGGGGGNGTGNPPAPNTGAGMTEADIAKTVEKMLLPREGAFIQYVADATNFSSFHLQQFKETLDVGAIVGHPKIAELGFKGVYEELHREKLEAMRVSTEKAKEDAIRADERQKIAASAPVDMPYPIASEGSPLDALSLDPDKRPKGDPVAATRMYEQLVAGSAGR